MIYFLIDKECRQMWYSHLSAFVNLASIWNQDVEKMDLNNPPKYTNSPEHLSYTIDVKSQEEWKTLIQVLSNYVKNKTFIGISQIKLVYVTGKSKTYYLQYSHVLKLCKCLGINQNVIRTVRFDQYEQQEFMEFVINKVENIWSINYFYSIDMPNSNWIVYDEISKTFKNKYRSVVTFNRNISCHMISISVQDLEFVLSFIESINRFLLHRTEALQLLFNTNDCPELESIQSMVAQLIMPFHNVKEVSINVFDRFETLRKMLDLTLDMPKNIELYNIKDLDKLTDFEVNLKCLNCYFYVSSEFDKVTKYSCSYFDLTFYSFNVEYWDNGILVLKNFYNCQIKAYEKWGEETANHYVKETVEKFSSSQYSKENILIVIPLNEWRNGKICFNKLTYQREEFGKQLMNSINVSTKMMIDHKSVFKV